MEPIISNTRKAKVQDEDQFLSSLKKKVAAGPKRRPKTKFSDAMLEKVQSERIENAIRRAGDANIRDIEKRKKLKEMLLANALEVNLRELNRQRGLDMTLSQYRASLGL